MPNPSLQPLLAPGSIAIVGASSKPGSLGHDAVEMILRGGFKGGVYPVNPRYQKVLGLRCYSNLAAIGAPVDLTMLCVAASRIEQQVAAAIAAGTRALIVTANAILPQERMPCLADRIRKQCEQAGLPLCGHNAMGYYNNDIDLRACGFSAPDEGVCGNITFISQSGSVFSTLAHNDPQLKFNLAITTGCETVTDTAEYMHYALEQPTTKVVGLYLETIRKPQQFTEALKKAARIRVPVVAMKVGRSVLGAKFALSHSGGMAGDDDALQAVLDRYGVIRARSLDELANTLLLTSQYPDAPAGGLVAIADSGGERNLLADEAEHVGVGFTALSDSTVTALAAIQEFGQEAANPLDPWGTGLDFERIFGESMAIMMADDNSSIGVISQDVRDGYFLTEGCLKAIDIAREKTGKPLAFMTNFSGTRRSDTTQLLNGKGIPVMSGTRDALRAVKNYFSYRDFQYCVAPPPKNSPTINTEKLANGGIVQEHDALAVLAEAGVPVIASHLVHSRFELESIAGQLDFPVVLKTAAPGVLHKTEAGGVIMDIAGADVLCTAYADLSRRLGEQALIQPMVVKDRELILGMKTDDTFGPIVIVGAGGILAEYLKDRFTILPDAPEREIARKIQQLRVYKILKGVRGTDSIDFDNLVKTVALFAAFCGATADIVSEVDINPLHVSADQIIALDALIIGSKAKSG